jgi:ATP-binding protein involved in chromosome partitioning
MFEKMGIRVLGMVQNMSVFVCPKCGEETKIFAHDEYGRGGVENKSVELGVDFLGNIPLDAQICRDADRGMPTVVAEEAAGGAKRNSQYYERIAATVAQEVGLSWK